MSGRIAAVQGTASDFPDFRSPATLLRVFVLAESINLASVYAHGGGLAEMITMGPGRLLFDLCLLAVVSVLFAMGAWLKRQSFRVARMATLGTIVGVSGTITLLINARVGVPAWPDVMRAVVLSGLVGIAVMFYLEWRALSLTLSHGNSRLLALQARIRPHFLFNSLNSAIASVRGDPRLAERILLDLADLFRSVLSDQSALVTLGREVEVAKSYIEIEQLRLGDRLEVDWAVAEEAFHLEVPALILQPLLENAVYHGIERLEAGGRITAQIAIQGDRLAINVENPVPMGDTLSQAGNGMALDNIRERIALHYDGDARMEVRREGGRFVVSIILPLCSS